MNKRIFLLLPAKMILKKLRAAAQLNFFYRAIATASTPISIAIFIH